MIKVSADYVASAEAGCGGVDQQASEASTISRVYDWPVIRQRYVEGETRSDGTVHYPTQREIAADLGLVAERIAERSSNEGWVAQRTRWQNQVEEARRRARADRLAQAAVDIDDRALDVAKLGLQICMFELQRTVAAAQQARSLGDPAGGEVNPLKLQRLAAAVDLWHKIGMRAVGDPDAAIRLGSIGDVAGSSEVVVELQRDDPNRLAGVLGILRQAGLGDLFAGP